ncbi:TetR/AcrR family transcriptional regulator [Virgibacillus oceani]|uniref:TetR family transcriptional regulator n=1 Tax=Virgibacillus oceani TaxID=1479511 RepID=A0A917MB27_9BACI|nr:TetR/AcrR family transcriptional regulator [Virgibacillus oceani]GGG88892.1 TetR family transcriptional regulator [Virgibacillus oceani]
MPKQTFFNLPEEKKQTLIEAAKKEFSRVSLYKASISNIIKTSGIPRGSFYQYFDNKEDVFFFLLNEHAKERQKKFLFLLKETDGDIFETVTILYKSMLKKSQNQENRDFFRNAFLNMNYKIENIYTKELDKSHINKQFKKISHLINTSKLNINNDNELFHAIKIIMAVTFHNLVQSYAKEIAYDDAVEYFTLEMNLLKKGLYKHDDL